MGHQSTSIRKLSTSFTGPILAAGEFKRTVHLYDLGTSRRTRSVETTIDSGEKRLAISNDGTSLVVGAYEKDGVASYDADRGGENWRRADLGGVQSVRFVDDDSCVLCSLEEGSCHVLNAASGATEYALPGVTQAWGSPFGPLRFFALGDEYAIVDLTGSIVEVARVTFALLDVAFSPSAVCISEAAGPVRCINIFTGSQLWRFDPAQGTHFLTIAFSRARNRFVGVSWSFEAGGARLLHEFSPAGDAEIRADLGQTLATAFCTEGSLVVTSLGSMIDVVSGKLLGRLPFPPSSADHDTP